MKTKIKTCLQLLGFCHLSLAAVLADGLDWESAAKNELPPGWACPGEGQWKVLNSFDKEKHPVLQMESTGKDFVLMNYKLHTAYKGEIVGRCKIQFAGQCSTGAINFAMNGGGSRGGLPIYFTKDGAIEVADEHAARARLLEEYKTDVWYEIRACFSMTEETWEAQVTDLSTGKTASLKGLPWTCPAVRAEKACAGIAVSLWSPDTIYIAELEVGPPADDPKSKK